MICWRGGGEREAAAGGDGTGVRFGGEEGEWRSEDAYPLLLFGSLQTSGEIALGED